MPQSIYIGTTRLDLYGCKNLSFIEPPGFEPENDHFHSTGVSGDLSSESRVRRDLQLPERPAVGHPHSLGPGRLPAVRPLQRQLHGIRRADPASHGCRNCRGRNLTRSRRKIFNFTLAPSDLNPMLLVALIPDE